MQFLHRHNQHEAALQRAIYKLNRVPNHFEASQVKDEAYHQLIQQQVKLAEALKKQDSVAWARVVKAYEEIDRIQEQVRFWSNGRQHLSMKDYSKDKQQAQFKAAQAHIQKGLKWLEKGTSEASAKKAHVEFSLAKQYSQDLPEVSEQLTALSQKAPIKVLLQVENDSGLALPPSFFATVQKTAFDNDATPWREIYTHYQPGEVYDFTLTISLYDLRLQSKKDKLNQFHSIYAKGELLVVDNNAMNEYKAFPLRGYETWQTPLYDEPSYEPFFDKIARQMGEDVKLYLFYYQRSLFNP